MTTDAREMAIHALVQDNDAIRDTIKVVRESITHPPRNLMSRAVIGWDNFLRRLRRDNFRAFVHPPEAMLEVLRVQGLTPRFHHRGMAWQVVGLER